METKLDLVCNRCGSHLIRKGYELFECFGCGTQSIIKNGIVTEIEPHKGYKGKGWSVHRESTPPYRVFLGYNAREMVLLDEDMVEKIRDSGSPAILISRKSIYMESIKQRVMTNISRKMFELKPDATEKDFMEIIKQIPMVQRLLV